MPARRRLDLELVRRGLAASRTEARLAIEGGSVTVGGSVAEKPSTLVAPDQPINLLEPPRRFVSRGGDKLDAILERGQISVEGLVCLDAGASTGGFTDCLLQRGAASVVAVDVGYGQFDWRLREDERVRLLERTNVREVTSAALGIEPDLVVADLSFISLRLVMPVLGAVAAHDAQMVVLVKPQFEAGRDSVGPGGVVREPSVWARCLDGVTGALRVEGFQPKFVMASPLPGPAGNIEFLMHARRPARAAEDAVTAAMLEGAVAEGVAIAESNR